MQASLPHLLLFTLVHYGRTQARTFGHCEPVASATGWARLIDYRCNFMAYLWDLLAVSYFGLTLLLLLILGFAVWLVWCCCRCCSAARTKRTELCILRTCCCGRFSPTKLRQMLQLGSVIILCCCIVALALSWVGFVVAHRGFYDALDQWGTFIYTIVHFARSIHRAILAVRLGLQDLGPLVNVSITSDDFMLPSLSTDIMYQGLEEVRSGYDYLRYAHGAGQGWDQGV